MHGSFVAQDVASVSDSGAPVVHSEVADAPHLEDEDVAPVCVDKAEAKAKPASKAKARAVDVMKARHEYMAQFKRTFKGDIEGTSLHKAACSAWMASEERAQHIASYSDTERKRRRFA